MRDKYIDLLSKLLDYLTDEEILRVYRLAEYLGIHKKKGEQYERDIKET